MASRKISLTHGILSHFHFFCPTSVCILCTICVYIHASDCLQTVYDLLLLPNNTALKHFYTSRSGAKCWLDIYLWSAGLAVTGPIRDIGQKVLRSSFEQEQQQPSYCHILFLISFLEEYVIRNITIILCINYIMIYINYNYVVINNNLWRALRPYFAL